jgi:transposase
MASDELSHRCLAREALAAQFEVGSQKTIARAEDVLAARALGKVLPHLNIEIIKRSDRVSGFVVLPKSWIVERTIAWLNRCRRLAKDWENLNRKALAFLRLASIRLMLRKLCNPA